MSGYQTMFTNIQEKRYESKITWGDGQWKGGTREDYRADNRRLNELFQKELREAYEIEDEKFFAALFHKAWEDGHASGYSEVLVHFEDLFQLFRPFMDELTSLRKRRR